MSGEPIRVFWQPGCSSCVKVKEFLSTRGVYFISIDVLQGGDALAQLEALGAQSIPIVARGNSFVFAQSLPQVAEFLGLTMDAPKRLPADVLMTRWTYFLEAAYAATAQIPPRHLAFRPVPERDRSARALAYHVFQVPEAFIATVVDGLEYWTIIANEPAPKTIQNVDDILAYAQQMTARLQQWWHELDDKTCQWPVKTFYGEQPVVELLERQTWHSAQHARQLQTVLETFQVPLIQTIKASAYEGLPMPAGLWD